MKAIYILFLLAFPFSIHCQECKFGTNSGDLRENQPLLLITGSEKLLQPNKDGQFGFYANDKIDLACQTAFSQNFNKQIVTATCNRDGTFLIDQNNYPIGNITCLKKIEAQTRQLNTRCQDGFLWQIGFPVGNKFITTISLCHDAEKYKTRYTQYIVHPASKRGQPFSDSHFKKDGQRIECPDNRVLQKQVFMDILGTDIYIHNTNSFYLARGHLAANSEFVLLPSRRATYFLINTAFTWQAINNGNWRAFERAVQNLAYKLDRELEVYTGTFRTSKLPHYVTGRLTKLYTVCDANRYHRYPVPRLLFKIVIDNHQQRGVVLITVDNVYLQSLTHNHIVCTDILNRIMWIKEPLSTLRTIEKGYSYACEVNEFINRTQVIPNLSIPNVLDRQ